MPESFRSVWNEPRPGQPPRRVWRDWALVGVLTPVAVVEGLLRPDLAWRPVWIVVAAGLTPTLLWRRSRPLLMVAIAFGTCALASIVTGVDSGLSTLAYLLILLYAVVRWGSGREALLGAAIVLSKIGLSTALGYLTVASALEGCAVVLAAFATGAALRYRSWARTRELDQVKLLERERLARDLHDTVAHHVSAMAIRAQAGLATMHAQPDAASDALRLIEAEASRALAEMRTMVRALRRNEPAELAPNPRIRDLERLDGRARTGPTIDVELAGNVDDLPTSVQAAIFRLAQESVTNARRHARHATRVAVRVIADQSTVRLEVRDDGEVPVRSTAPPSGYGLIGMFERAELLGGTCTAGPHPDRGWVVSAVLPRTGSPA